MIKTAFTASLAALIKNFGLVVSFMGSFSNVLIVFILPQLFYVKLCEDEYVDKCIKSKKKFWIVKNPRTRFKIIPYLVIIVGSLVSIVGILMTIRDMAAT